MQRGTIHCSHGDFEVVIHDPHNLLTPADLNRIAYGHERKEHNGRIATDIKIERLSDQHSKQIIQKLIS